MSCRFGADSPNVGVSPRVATANNGLMRTSGQGNNRAVSFADVDVVD